MRCPGADAEAGRGCDGGWMNASIPSPEDITPDEPRPEELASADQVSHLPPSDSTRSPEELDPVAAEDAAAEDDLAGNDFADSGAGVADDTGEADPDVGATGTIRQLPAEDTLESTGGRDLVDEGFNAPDAPGPLYEETVGDQVTGSALDERLDAEEPDVGD